MLVHCCRRLSAAPWCRSAAPAAELGVTCTRIFSQTAGRGSGWMGLRNTSRFSLAAWRPALFDPSSPNTESFNQGPAVFSSRLMYYRRNMGGLPSRRGLAPVLRPGAIRSSALGLDVSNDGKWNCFGFRETWERPGPSGPESFDCRLLNPFTRFEPTFSTPDTFQVQILTEIHDKTRVH